MEESLLILAIISFYLINCGGLVGSILLNMVSIVIYMCEMGAWCRRNRGLAG